MRPQKITWRILLGSPMLTIPAIVQRALGTHNISRSNTNNDGKYPISNDDNSRHGVIGGLQGYYLPRYLQLRTQTMTSNWTLAMSRSRRDDDDNESLLESPAAVEMTPRLVCEGSGGATNSSKSSNCKEMMKSRKRKRNYNASSNNNYNIRQRRLPPPSCRDIIRVVADSNAAPLSAALEAMDDGQVVDKLRSNNQGNDNTHRGDNIDVSYAGERRTGGRKRKRGRQRQLQQQQWQNQFSKFTTTTTATPPPAAVATNMTAATATSDTLAATTTVTAATPTKTTTTSTTTTIMSKQDWVHYQMMTRVIIAPFTLSLIQSVTNNEEQSRQHRQHRRRITSKEDDEDGNMQQQFSSSNSNNKKVNSSSKSCVNSIEVMTTAREDVSININSSLPTNVYQKKKSNTTANDTLSSSTTRESLESIVDGAVCTLVRRSHRFRHFSISASMSKQRRQQQQEDTVIVKHTRRRRKREQQQARTEIVSENNDQEVLNDSGITAYSSSANNSNYDNIGNDTNNNNWLLGENLLSSGYSLGSGGDQSSNSQQQLQQRQSLRGCPNMAPGIHCLHPNTLTSYARSSSFMKFLHAKIGDDAILREILVNTIVLVPVIPTSIKIEDTTTSSLLFQRGNYFQLCGPPLTMLSKKFDTSDSVCTSRGSSSKKKSNDNGRQQISVSDITSSTPSSNDDQLLCKSLKNEQWDPNKLIPRGSLFYCEFYTKHVGLSPRHLLNQRDTNKEGSENYCTHTNKELAEQKHINDLYIMNDVNVKLLNAMVGLWQPAGKQKDSGSFQDSRSSGVVAVGGNKKRRRRWQRLRQGGIAMCREIRRRQQKCDYARLLERHCPLPIIFHGGRMSSANRSTHLANADIDDDDVESRSALSRHVTLHHTPVENVGSFLESVLKDAFPHSFWGSHHNFDQVVRTMRLFTRLGRTEQLPEKAIVDGIRVLDMTWIHRRDHAKNNCSNVPGQRCRKLSLSDHNTATTLVRNVLRWLYRQFIIPLLRSTFYITETEFTGSSVLYYRRPVWSRIKSLSMKTLLKQRQYREMSVEKIQKVLSNHNVGCPPAPLRILPKLTGIRAIAMLSKSCAVGDKTGNFQVANANQLHFKNRNIFPSPNKILQSTFNALKYEHEMKPTLFGAGVLGLTEVFPSFCQFVTALKLKSNMQISVSRTRQHGNMNSERVSSRGGGDAPRALYFASADIKHCYDTINQKHLYDVLRSVINEDVYLTKNSFVLHTKDNDSAIRCQWKKSTFPPERFSQLVATSDAFSSYFNSIFVDSVYCSLERKENIIGLLRDHIFGQVVVANGHRCTRLLHQRDGIPQGSILSSMFCNIYFGNIESILLDDVIHKRTSHIIRGSTTSNCDAAVTQCNSHIHLLVRIVDDFLLISTCKDTSTRFLTKLSRGIPGLGVKINSEKSRASYQVSIKNSSTGKMEAVSVCRDYFPWCGLLIDTRTCEIRLDHKRFGGSHAIDTVVIHRTGNEGMYLKKKMKDFVRPRCCQKLLFSSCINGIDTIQSNFYQMFLLCAIKLLHYMNECGDETASLTHQNFIYNSAVDTISYAYLLISSKIRHGNGRAAAKSSSDDDMTFQLSWIDALWLGKQAFFRVFQQSAGHTSQLSHSFYDSSTGTSNVKQLLKVIRRTHRMFPIDDI